MWRGEGKGEEEKKGVKKGKFEDSYDVIACHMRLITFTARRLTKKSAHPSELQQQPRAFFCCEQPSAPSVSFAADDGGATTITPHIFLFSCSRLSKYDEFISLE